MPKAKTRQQRRARSRAPLKRKRRGSLGFVLFLTALVVGGSALIAYLRFNQPPLTRGAIAGEHWHASLKINICGEQVTNFPNVEGEIHSHGDGFMHIHPSTPAASGDLASVGTFLSLYETSLSRDDKGRTTLAWPDKTSYTDGDRCKNDKKKYTWEATIKGKEFDGDPGTILPHNGDAIVLQFGPKPKSAKDLMPNPYAKAKGLPDPGVANSDAPVNDGAAPAQPEVPVPATSGEPEGSAEPDATAKN